MFNIANISIKNKLIVIQLCTAIVAIILCGIFFVISYYNIFNSYKVESLESIAVLVGDNVITALEFGEAYQEEAEIALSKLSKHPQIVNAVLYNNTKQEVADLADKDNPEKSTTKWNVFAKYGVDVVNSDYDFTSAATEVGKRMSILQQTISTRDKDYLNVYYGLYDDQNYLGTLCIRADLELGVILKQYIFISFIVLILGFLIAFLLAQLLQKSISGPILELVTTMKEVSEKQDYSVRTNQKGHDEIAELSQVFDEMLIQIQKRDKSLQEAQSELESRVIKRTRELQLRTNELQLKTNELQQKTKELEMSNRELEQFAYVASHDLQEPLRMIGSFSQLIANRYQNMVDDEMNEFIHYIVDGVSRMQKLIKDLLLLSRVGTQKMNVQDINLSNVLLKSLSNLRYVIQENDAQITHNELPNLSIDEVKITQLFQNLISNAIKFRSEEPPKIHIHTEERESEWFITISDNGIGIDKGYAEKIFLIFQRLNRDQPGTGIGLSICKKIVELHGGTIWFESEVGKGTTFFFTLLKKGYPNKAIDPPQLGEKIAITS